ILARENMVSIFWIAMAVIVAGNIIYHIAQKSIPQNANPLASVIVSYVVAIAVSLFLLPKYLSGTTFLSALRTLNWSSIIVGIGIVGIEFGFLLAYRAGWQINVAALIASVLLALILLPIGTFAFQESWSWPKTVGLVLCMIGLVLLQRG
ncbi:hypothetical protein DCC62_27410, partial [candidate division KSB1 bacterium]